MVSTVEELRGRKRRMVIIAVVVLLSLAAIIWSTLAYLGVKKEFYEIGLREEKLTRVLVRKRADREELDTQQIRSEMGLLRQRLVQDPAEFPIFLDGLQQLGLNTGVKLNYAVGEPQGSNFDPEIGWRDLILSFREVDYPQLLSFANSLYGLSEKWLVEVKGLKLLENKGGALLSGRFDLRLWTRQSGVEIEGGGADSLTH